MYGSTQSSFLLNGNGDAIIFPTDNVQPVGVPEATSSMLNVVHTERANTIDFTPGTAVLFGMRTLGLSFDAVDGSLLQSEDTGAAVPLAFDLTDPAAGITSTRL